MPQIYITPRYPDLTFMLLTVRRAPARVKLQRDAVHVMRRQEFDSCFAASKESGEAPLYICRATRQFHLSQQPLVAELCPFTIYFIGFFEYRKYV
jgi:hypothetical protein